ncbi:hypothetical protein AJ85_05680 [Alkalihalobacillus alcalophilus ATCC 27647 = CGMCC 1.3604]|uniref:Aspartate ammonia-lyase n=1 Tax=Alkalihalobacillus alcalophilus ATCC 27647 = CGMCC 1.3604 TaxID=1218173 RepID=A0A094YTR4_ALKAL|nr:hypothetical protein [Alkalihalobacillus alcalophilus]YP_009276836.1 hypothetical protein BH791_gp30 [Bacillus phage BalMu-1]AJA42408.1 hypothetical protein BalMu1_B30 [Bacillus phage BalMu-1]AJA42464.1 hypothetical protein BalMu1_A30 [Bacillus phage BalMu-1]KGA96862.1 aspartate ammonia-lyase [Alkalihalobacillus alcalophilus ATCC 27647 = CGMCC 1.3604]MED1561151.1 aspartate ammonia-lyase [Alkalihalobacillus alcalophilus]THG91313.1 hypothetical protein AJ85_05680 [Alkalihalobacillus alcaloph
MARIWSRDALLEDRRKGTHQSNVSYKLNGVQNEVEKKIVNGEMETVELAVPIGEMMSSDTARKELMRKVVLDVEMGREQVPILYRAIYDMIKDSNFPRDFKAKWAQRGAVVFNEHFEGAEVKFGTLSAEEGPVVSIKGYTAGFEYTKEMQEFNETFNFELLNKAFGEAHHAILNHLHLSPIFKFGYKAVNKTAAKYVDPAGKKIEGQSGSHYLLSLRESIRQGLNDARGKKRPPTILLANPVHQEDIRDAIGSFAVGGGTYRPLEGIRDLVFYEGWEGQVGKKVTLYEGVPEDKIYLIRPKKGFKEIIKQDLEINSSMGDITRLVESQVVGDFWRAVFAAVEENVQEVTLPAQS